MRQQLFGGVHPILAARQQAGGVEEPVQAAARTLAADGARGGHHGLCLQPLQPVAQRVFLVEKSSGAIYLKSMATVTEIGGLISRNPDIRGGRPCIAGTGVSVRRVAQWHRMGLIPEEIVRKFGHVSLAQVYAALAFYYANQAELDADLEDEMRQTEALERQHRR